MHVYVLDFKRETGRQADRDRKRKTDRSVDGRTDRARDGEMERGESGGGWVGVRKERREKERELCIER